MSDIALLIFFKLLTLTFLTRSFSFSSAADSSVSPTGEVKSWLVIMAASSSEAAERDGFSRCFTSSFGRTNNFAQTFTTASAGEYATKG